MVEDDSPAAFNEEAAPDEDALTMSGEDSGSIDSTLGGEDPQDVESTTDDSNAVPPALEDSSALDEREDQEESLGKA